MRKIIKIAKLELSLMFYSPIAWFVLIIFFIQTGLTFTELLYKYETNQQLGRPLSVLTKILYAGEDGILAKVQNYLYLYIPLLTMGLMSKETSSGSIKLLYSSPVKIKEIILGKYLSMAIYNLLLAILLSSFIVVGTMSIVAVDIKFVLGGILGVYLLMSAYAAIGLFMSTLTNYQVVAAISTLAVLAFFNFIGNVGQVYDFIREITYWLSMRGRANYFVNGLIGTKDILYFLLVIFLFLILGILKLTYERKRKSLFAKTLSYSGLFVFVMGLGYVSSLPTINKYYDTTRFKDRTLTETSQEIIKRLEEPIHMTNYVNLIHSSARYGAPENRIKDLRSFEKYRRFIPKMEMNYVYYYDSITYMDTTKTMRKLVEKAARVHHVNLKNVLSPEQIRKKIDLKSEDNRFVRFIHYGDQTIPLRMFDDIYVYPNETDITSTLKRLIQKQGVVGMLTGNGERDTYKKGNDSYKYITKGLNVRGSLINSGFDVLDISLKETDTINTTLDVLVISDPKYAYSKKELQKINTYIKAGGNLLLAGEPGKQELLNPIVNTFGVAFLEGELLQESENFELDLIQSKFAKQEALKGFKFHESAVVVHPKAMGITYENTSEFETIPLLISNKENTWRRTEPFDLNIEKIVFDSINNRKEEIPVAIAMKRKINGSKEQRIVVLGDADFMSNAQVTRNSPRNVNVSFTKKMFKWFSNNEYSVSIKRPKPIDTEILMTRKQINWLKVVVLGIIPFLIAILGGTILIKRHRN
ncbi:Gldg family protein [Wenyingzhuangia sp. 2_MG-2023]|uniref:Gldg family protein n=1 Tax=Wenyingzhuangia sp. 2_MG-2023 TaxID=3062639 RepID=UPI0026E2AEEB|nr:Gldg family protein [Wenyingzhuangia sp. 2_MG-2023]MDO6736376.1 Gldg family protein [Wenyingzhuangia sp. 2_MG-2023]